MVEVEFKTQPKLVDLVEVLDLTHQMQQQTLVEVEHHLEAIQLLELLVLSYFVIQTMSQLQHQLD